MSQFEVTISEMRNAASKIAQAAEDFLSTANQAFASAQALADSWEGDSQVAFADEQQRANEWYKQMVDIVNTYVASLQTTAQKYQEADEEARNAIKG